MEQQDTKRRILTEALKLFSTNGYEAVSVEQIARAVGIKAPSLYKHYKSKRDIFDNIIVSMNEMDLERAKEYEMPEGTMEEVAEAYQLTPLEKIKTYTGAQFRHWTEESFSACFRKMLTLEQYRSPEMAQLYQRYLAAGPLMYMRDIFASITEESDAMQIALAFYGPIFLLYSVYDGAEDKEEVNRAVIRHVEHFTTQLQTKSQGRENI
jgi:AcrR family transcriptional regulator